MAANASSSATAITTGHTRCAVQNLELGHDGKPADPRKRDLRHLREQGLIRTVQLHGHRSVAVVLTERGRELLESRRRDRGGDRHDGDRYAARTRNDSRSHGTGCQAFYAELKKPREVEHDVQIERLKHVGEMPPLESTTRLGDWYGNILRIGHRQTLIFISERSRIPVIIPMREAKRLPTVFPDAVCDVLTTVGVSAKDIAEERARMLEITFGPTRNRSVLGTLNDFAQMAKYANARQAEPESPEELMRFLAQTPILPLHGASPIALTRAAFRQA